VHDEIVAAAVGQSVAKTGQSRNQIRFMLAAQQGIGEVLTARFDWTAERSGPVTTLTGRNSPRGISTQVKRFAPSHERVWQPAAVLRAHCVCEAGCPSVTARAMSAHGTNGSKFQPDPTKKRQQGLQKEIIRVGKSVERILSAYQEGLVSLEQLRERMPPLRQREQALREEARAIADQSNDSAMFLRLAETLTDFLTRPRNSANTLDVIERQRIVRLVVKDVLIGDDSLVIRHCIPIVAPSPSGGTPPAAGKVGGTSNSQNYLLRKGSALAHVSKHRNTSSQRGRTRWWITTFGKRCGAGRGVDTQGNRPHGFGKSTSELSISDNGCLLPQFESITANRERWRCIQRQLLGSSDMSELNRTLTHSIRLGTPISHIEERRECGSGCRTAASQNDSGSSKTANARDALSPSRKMIDGRFNPLSHSRLGAFARSPT
jgi:hypothetical protein